MTDPAATSPGEPSEDAGEEQAASLTAAGSSSGLAPAGDSSPLPFADLRAPSPIAADPPSGARWLAFGSILLGGLLGGLIGYGTADLLAGTSLWAGFGAILGAASGAVGVGVVAGLTLRAMNEWQAVSHPEAGAAPARGRPARRRAP